MLAFDIVEKGLREGKTYSQISEDSGIPRSTVKALSVSVSYGPLHSKTMKDIENNPSNNSLGIDFAELEKMLAAQEAEKEMKKFSPKGKNRCLNQ